MSLVLKAYLLNMMNFNLNQCLKVSHSFFITILNHDFIYCQFFFQLLFFVGYFGVSKNLADEEKKYQSPKFSKVLQDPLNVLNLHLEI